MEYLMESNFELRLQELIAQGMSEKQALSHIEEEMVHEEAKIDAQSDCRTLLTRS